jgi:DNA polymerase-3 subunit delta
MIPLQDLPNRLQSSLAPLYVIYGEEILIALEAADQIRRSAGMQGFTEREIFTVESGFSWSTLTYTHQALSLFSNKKLIELRIPSGKPGTEGSQVLIRYVEQLAPDTLTLIILPKLDKVTQNSKWFKALSAHGELIAAQPVGRSHLPIWVQARLKLQQQHLSADALIFFCERVEGNLLAAHQEIQKLALLYPAGEINLSALQDAIVNVARYDVFKLTEALLMQDAVRFCRMLRGLIAEGEAATLILWVLAEEIRTLLAIGQGIAKKIPMAELLRTHRVWGERAKLVEPMLRQLNARHLREALMRCAHIDTLIKGLAPGHIEDALQAIGLSLIPATADPFLSRIPA